MKKIIISVAVATLALTTVVSAGDLTQTQVMKVGDSNSAFAVSSNAGTGYNAVPKRATHTPRALFTGAEIEKAIDAVRLQVHTLHNVVVDMDLKKNNPIKADIQNYDLGADADRKQYSEQDRVALKALEQEAATLRKELAAVQKLIPIADSGYALPTNSEINVIGTSQIQVYPIMDGEEAIGTYRVACSGALKEDILINQTSVNYCVASLYINGAPRVSDTAEHKAETTDMFYIGISESYVAGKASKVKIKWQDHPKSSVMGALNYYNLDHIPNVVNALTWEAPVTMSNGTVFPGKNAMVGQ